jgi:prepilin-type N-terminal cleavage/methylation domain-containing protein
VERAARNRDDGFTLVEMIVASAVFSLVAITVMGVLLTTTTTESKVRTVTAATNQAQLVSRVVGESITNAATPISLLTINGADQLVRVRAAGTDSTLGWSCQAFYFSATDDTIRTTKSSTAVGQPTNAQQRSWTLLADQVRSTTVFSQVGTTDLTVAFGIAAGDAPDVVLETTFTSQTRVIGGSPCF